MSRSVAAVQQAMARMLFDPGFVAAVHAGPVDGLTEAERQLLLGVDRRAWGTDRYRRSRGVQALLEEYPVTAGILGVDAVDAFFSSSSFVAVLRSRGSLGLAFGDHVAESPAGEVARLEQAVARARRDVACRVRPGRRLRTRPGVVPLETRAPVLACFSSARRKLGADPVQVLVERHLSLAAPEPGGEPVFVLVECSRQGEVQVGGSSPALHGLLLALKAATPRSAALAHAREQGCDAGEDEELLMDLTQEGLVIETA